MKEILLYLFIISTLHISFAQDNSKLLINEISEHTSDFYISNSGNLIKFENFSLNSPFLNFGNPFINNFICSNKFNDKHDYILTLQPESNLKFNMSGSSNVADISSDFSTKKRYSYLNIKLNYFLIDRYQTNQNKYFDDVDVYYNKLKLKTFISLFDEQKFLNFYTENYYGNTSFPSMYRINNLKRENDKWFGKYGFSFGSDNDNFNFNGNFYYAMLNETVSFTGRTDKYNSKYDNINLDMNFDFNITNNSKTSIILNYYDLQIIDYLFLGNFLGKVANERIRTGIENQHIIADKISVLYGADIAYTNINYEDLSYKTDKLFPSVKIELNYRLNNSNQFKIKASHISHPSFNMSDTVNHITNIRLGTEYSYQKNDFNLMTGAYYNSINGLSSFSRIIPDTKSKEVKNFGLFLKLNGKIKKVNYLIKYSMNELENSDVLFMNYLAMHNILFRFNQTYKFGFGWDISGNFKSGIDFFDPNLKQYIESDDFFVLNMQLSYQLINYIKIYFKANNILDSKFLYDFFLPAQSRMIIGGLQITI